MPPPFLFTSGWLSNFLPEIHLVDEMHVGSGVCGVEGRQRNAWGAFYPPKMRSRWLFIVRAFVWWEVKRRGEGRKEGMVKEKKPLVFFVCSCELCWLLTICSSFNCWMYNSMSIGMSVFRTPNWAQTYLLLVVTFLCLSLKSLLHWMLWMIWEYLLLRVFFFYYYRKLKHNH